MRPGVPEVIPHKRGATLRIPRSFPDDPVGWTFTAALLLPDGAVVPLTCDALRQADYMGDLSVAPNPGVVFLGLDAAETGALPVDVIPGEFTARLADQVAKSATFYLQIFPEVSNG